MVNGTIPTGSASRARRVGWVDLATLPNLHPAVIAPLAEAISHGAMTWWARSRVGTPQADCAHRAAGGPQQPLEPNAERSRDEAEEPEGCSGPGRDLTDTALVLVGHLDHLPSRDGPAADATGRGIHGTRRPDTLSVVSTGGCKIAP